MNIMAIIAWSMVALCIVMLVAYFIYAAPGIFSADIEAQVFQDDDDT
ncbi:MAG: hypothetical protein GY938_05455 [Ketobacter sp.]|nr:hypothetical protein [Ketobacter sp.]